MSWPIVELGDVAEIIMGQAPSGETYNDNGEGTPLVAGAGDFGEKTPQVKKFTTSPTKMSLPNDIIMSIRATIGTKVLSDQSYCLGRGVAAIRATPRLNERFLWHVLTNLEAQLSSKGRGATFPQVSKSDIVELPFPLPPLEEQRRIAAVLDRADQLRQQRQQAITLLDTLTQSLFLDMFGDPVTNPKGWPLELMGQITTSRLGKMLDKKKMNGLTEYPYLANLNVQWNRVELNDIRKMGFSDKERKEFSLEYGDLLICEGGEIGRCAVWKSEIQDCYYQKALHRVRCLNNLCTPEYLLWFFWFMAKHKGLDKHTAIATISHLTGERLRKMHVPLPPKKLQDNFSALVETLDVKKKRFELSYKKINSLFSSLQQHAFSGQL